MALRAGEENVATLYADIHYFYGAPTVKPPHHRFDKGSYVYLFEDSSQRRARIEIANNAGTPDQDAFNGYLDSCHVDYTYKHPTLVTITVDGRGAPASTDTSQWHLPTYDPRNENKYMYRLHTLDIYFWTKEDGIKFIEALRRVLPAQSLSIKDEPVAPAHTAAMSPVVQKLEQVAISDNSARAGSAQSQALPSFAPPPKAETPASQEAPQSFTPFAYNPAAPAAPETIRHREKTPPPDDGGANPLMAAETSDHAPPFSPYGSQFKIASPPSAIAPQAAFLPQAPPPSAGLQSPFSQPAVQPAVQPAALPHPPLNRGMTFPLSPGLSNQAYTQSLTGFAPPPTGAPQTQYANYPGSPGFAPSALSPGFGQVPSSPPAYTATPGTPGIQNYQSAQSGYDLHHQLYVPTESDKAGHVKKTEPRGKLEERAARLEKGVGGFLKKLEKRIG